MKQVVILDSDRAPDKRKWEVMIPPNLAILTRGTVENINEQNCVCCNSNPITSGVVVVHWSKITPELFTKVVAESENQDLYFVVISGNGFGSPPLIQLESRVYFRKAPVIKSIDKEFAVCFTRFWREISSGEDFRASVHLLEPSKVDILNALRWNCQISLRAIETGTTPSLADSAWRNAIQTLGIGLAHFDIEWATTGSDHNPKAARKIFEFLIKGEETVTKPTTTDYQSALEEIRNALDYSRSR